jgi:hypothetical protein
LYQDKRHARIGIGGHTGKERFKGCQSSGRSPDANDGKIGSERFGRLLFFYCFCGTLYVRFFDFLFLFQDGLLSLSGIIGYSMIYALSSAAGSVLKLLGKHLIPDPVRHDGNIVAWYSGESRA